MPQVVKYQVIVGLKHHRNEPVVTTGVLSLLVPDTAMPEQVEVDLQDRIVEEWVKVLAKGTPFDMERVVDSVGDFAGRVAVAADEIAYLCTKILSIGPE